MANDATLTVLCAGDRFIRSSTLAEQARAAFDGLGDRVEIVEYESAWPDEPWHLEIDGVREAAGDPGEVAQLAAGADVLLTHLAPVPAAVLDAASRLRVIGVTRGGPVNVDLAAATSAGVPVVYLPGRNSSAVAEFTVGVMIDLPRRISSAAAALAGGDWRADAFRFTDAGPELSACTVGLVGLGAVGVKVADLLAAFGARVVGYDPYAPEAVWSEHTVEQVELDALLADCDIVSLHARATDDTRGLIGPRTLGLMRPGAYLVNTARGELVDEQALLAALDDGRLAGAALDVYASEPPLGSPLLGHPRVLATPHIAGASVQVATLSAARVAAEVAGFLRDGTLEHCANPDWAAADRHA